jgi:hypothetical protein
MNPNDEDKERDNPMNVKNSLYGAILAAAMMVTMVPGKALARGGADDAIPGAGHPVA